MAKLARPAARYPGGKYMLADWLLGFFPPHRIYVEPYGGAASILLSKERVASEIYNDLDGEIVNLFRVLRSPDQSKKLKRLLELTPFARMEFRQSYKASKRPLEQARRTIVRSFMGARSRFGCRSKHRIQVVFASK